MADQDHWQLNDSAPALYERYLVPAITSVWAADLIERARPKPGEAGLDVACGTGAVTRLIAERTAGGRVVGLDLNPGMLAVARSVPTAAAIQWVQGSALCLPFADSTFDLVLCQLGLQFFPDRLLALRELRRVLTPDGRMALNVYSGIERTPAAHAFATALDQRLGPDASRIKRAEHSFADARALGTLMSQAGLDHVEVTTVTQHITFPSVFDYVRFQLIATPMASLLSDRGAVEREAVISAIAADTQSRLDHEMLRDGRLTFPQEAHVATAGRAS